MSGQWAGKNLDSSEKFYLGGSSGVRAYPSSEGGGSTGQLLNVELRWQLPHGMNLVGFYDHGRVTQNVTNDFTGAPVVNRFALSIVNQGSITAGLGGYIALLAPEVRNQGVVVAQLGGTVALAAGESYQLQLNSNGQLTNVLVAPATIQTLVDNGNAVQAPGGLVILSAQAASGLLGGVVKNSGAISATGMVSDGGTIRLSASHKIELAQTSSIRADAAANSAGKGGRIDIIADLSNASSSTQVDGSISAKAGEQGGDGGFVDTSAARLAIAETTLVTTGAAMGNAGTWLLDPYDVIIAGPSDTASGKCFAHGQECRQLYGGGQRH